MLRPWPTTHYVTLATLSLTLACSSAAPGDTEAGVSSSSGTTSEQTTQSSVSDPTLPTSTGETPSTDGPVTTSLSTSDTGNTTDLSTTTTDDSSTTATGTTTGETTESGTSTGEPGTSSSGSSSTGEPGESCVDGLQNQDETSVDCGGSCSPCADGEACLVDADCTSSECTENICVAAACDDGVENGAETDVDCGGPNCTPCADGLACAAGSDCASQSCVDNLCVAPSCADAVKNAGETDVDCGGPDCDPCADGGACMMNPDCASGVCTANICTAGSCFDGLKNGEETEIDCGGPACAPCQLQTLVINEIDYDQAGNDTAEFIEIFNNTGAPVDLANLEVRLVNGAGNAVYGTIKLAPGGMLAQGQYLVIGPAGFAVPPGTVFIPTALAIQNGDPDGLALVDVTNKVVLDAFSYGGAINAAVLGAPFVGSTSLVEGQAFPANIKDNNDPSRSLARIPNGNDKNNAATDWAAATSTPGAANKP